MSRVGIGRPGGWKDVIGKNVRLGNLVHRIADAYGYRQFKDLGLESAACDDNNGYLSLSCDRPGEEAWRPVESQWCTTEEPVTCFACLAGGD